MAQQAHYHSALVCQKVVHLLTPVPASPSSTENTQHWGLLNDCQVFQEAFPWTSCSLSFLLQLLSYSSKPCLKGSNLWKRGGGLSKMSHAFVPITLKLPKSIPRLIIPLSPWQIDSISLTFVLFKASFQISKHKQRKNLSERARLLLLLWGEIFFSSTLTINCVITRLTILVSATVGIHCARSVSYWAFIISILQITF